jgi:DinB superfamily
MDGQIEMAKRWTESSRAGILKALETTPDDKLNWSPSSTSRSSLKIAAHAGISAKGISSSFSGENAGPAMAFDQVMVFMKAEEDKVTTREQAIALVNDGCDATIKALDKITPEQLSSIAKTPFGEVPMASWILIPSLHMDCHRSQIDFLQTVWGDMEMHM